MARRNEIKRALSWATTRELVALHNVQTMGATCLQVGDTSHGRFLLATADEELRGRGIEVVDGKLLNEA